MILLKVYENKENQESVVFEQEYTMSSIRLQESCKREGFLQLYQSGVDSSSRGIFCTVSEKERVK